MTWIILFAAVGITLVCLEIIIPGGILGGIGAISILVSCILCFKEFGSMGGLLGSVAILLATSLALWASFKALAKPSLGKRAFLTKSIEGTSASYGEEAKELIGKSAVAKTTLAPSGYVTIGGTRYEAFCQTGLIEAGTRLKVIGADNFRLIVTPESGSI